MAEVTSDPGDLWTKYIGLVEREKSSRQKARAADRDRKELERLRREKAELTQRLGSANAALDAYRAETARLKGDLKRVRGSRAYRVGRAIAAPAALVRTSRQVPAAGSTPMDSSKGASASTVPGQRHNGHQVGDERRLSDYSYDELLTRFAEQPTPERLGHVLSRAWFQQGLVSQPAELLGSHPEIAGALGPRDRQLAERILAAHRIRRDGVSLPARGRGPAYVPEQGRVLYCVHSTPAFNTNGYSLRTRGVASGLRAADADVVVVSRSGYPWDSKVDVAKPKELRHVVEVDGVEYVHLPGHALASTPTDHYLQECADAFVREARLRRPALVQAASNYRVGLAALIAARRIGVPFVYEVRGLWEVTEASDKPGWEETERFRIQADLETLVAREADGVLAITEQTRDELVRRGVDPARITVAPNAVDPREFLPLPKDAAYAAQCGLRTDVPVIGFAGSMVPYEGLAVLVDAAALLRDRRVDVQVALAGSGSAEPALKEQVAELGLESVVRFLGRVPSAQVPRLLSLFDVMPCPRLSLPVTEMVSPLKPLEALSSSKAVVLSDVAPHRDLAGDGETRARLFRAGDPTSLADVLQQLVEAPDACADLGRTGRLWCLDERTWTRLGAQMLIAHRSATERAIAAAEAAGPIPLASLRIGLIADEFTTETLTASFDVVPLEREGWPEQLVAGLDLVLVESAWNGNGGQWHRGVGQYTKEEHSDLVSLLARARELGVPSVFWNKEDPVHFDRFVPTATLCDHVFTTDANKIADYATAGVGTVRTVASLPFHAQPRLHNPLPGARPFEHTAAYAGTYYGDRYAKRSQELSRLLETARPFGLAIYDRQADQPDSPYHFPPAFTAAVRGSLPYYEVIDSYKAHLASLNVNSVSGSPTMFSRRVVEVAACGGVVLSGPGRGIDETLGSAIPTSSDPLVWRALLRTWSDDPGARLREGWLQMRTVLRAHTVESAMAIVARTAGVPVAARALPTYAVRLNGNRPDVMCSVLGQSVRPAEVWCEEDAERLREALAHSGIRVLEVEDGSVVETACDFVGVVDEPVGRTHFEDLLLADLFGPWERIVPVAQAAPTHGEPLALPIPSADVLEGLVSTTVLRQCAELSEALRVEGLRGVRLLVPSAPTSTAPVTHVAGDTNLTLDSADSLHGLRVLVAGHDLKFATSLMDELRNRGATVNVDEWSSHSDHDETRSTELLADADVVFCEWGLGNAVWYSQHIGPDQRLVVRVHSQELRRPYLARIHHEAVNAYVFVGGLVLEAAIRSHGLPRDRCIVVPNPVDVEALRRDKHDGADTTIGLVGIVPRTKRLDLALDVVEGLRARGLPHTLRVRGKVPADFAWMQQRPDELEWYERQLARIDVLNADQPGSVVLEGHGDDMPEWYRGIGVALSVSDFESFHLTIADGAASGALPATLAWPGADLVYPREWISPTIDSLVERIATAHTDAARLRAEARERFAGPVVLDRLVALLSGEVQP
ncbi:glycosyltransferase [Terrabacter sp. GCM10028922]|uniref:glycosyltransferase n=1 Tax=Terrabacter sp. GCM10028922 TaxID=3273428 RepID=UPI0036DF02BA